MSKRNKVVIETVESKALKEFRITRGHSLQKVADLVGVSKQQVHIMESGRANISKNYVNQFLKALEFSEQDWLLAMGGEKQTINMVLDKMGKDCMAKLQNLPEEKLKLLHSILSGL